MRSLPDCIIVTSDEPYSNMWHTQLIYAEYLSQGCKLIFVDPPQKWKFRNIFGILQTRVRAAHNLQVYSYNNVLPASPGWCYQFNEWLNQRKLCDLLKQQNCTNLLIWHFDSYRSGFKASFFLRAFTIRRVYHVIDPFYNNPLNKRLCELADVIVLTSPRLRERYKQYSEKVIQVPQCIDLKLTEELLRPQAIHKIGSPYFVLLGTISDDLDFDWLLRLSANRAFELVLIGAIKRLENCKHKFEDLLTQPGIHYLGALSPSDFYPILKNARAGLMVYGDYRKDKIFSPLKAINYLVAKIPVISNMYCEIEELGEPFIYTAETYSTFESTVLHLAVNAPELDKTLLNNYLQGISLEQAVNRITEYDRH